MTTVKEINDGKQLRVKVPNEIRKFKEVMVRDVSNIRHSLNGLINKVAHEIESKKNVESEKKKIFFEEVNDTKATISSLEKDLIKKAQPMSDFDQLLNLHDLFERDVKKQSQRFSSLVSEIDKILASSIEEQTINSLNLSKYNLESLLYQLEDFQLRKHDFEKNLSKERDLENFLEIRK